MLQLLLGTALLPAGLLRGTTEGIDADWVRSLTGVGLRVAAISVLGAMLGLSLAIFIVATAVSFAVIFVAELGDKSRAAEIFRLGVEVCPFTRVVGVETHGRSDRRISESVWIGK